MELGGLGTIFLQMELGYRFVWHSFIDCTKDNKYCLLCGTYVHPIHLLYVHNRLCICTVCVHVYSIKSKPWTIQNEWTSMYMCICETGLIQCPFVLFCVNRQQFLGVIYGVVVVVVVIIVVSNGGGDDEVGSGSHIYNSLAVVMVMMNKASNSNYTFYSNGIY